MTLIDEQFPWQAMQDPPSVPSFDMPQEQAPIRLAILDRDPLVRAGLRALLQSDARVQVVADCESLPQMRGASLTSRPELLVVGADQLGERFKIDYHQSPVLRECLPPLIAVMPPDDQVVLHDAMMCSVRGYVDRATSQDDLAQAIHVVRAGNTYLSPTIAAAVIAWISARIRQERMPSPQIERILTDRELQVLNALGEGITNTAIARRLRISDATVRSHTYHILAKLGLTTRTEAVLVGHNYSSGGRPGPAGPLTPSSAPGITTTLRPPRMARLNHR